MILRIRWYSDMKAKLFTIIYLYLSYLSRCFQFNIVAVKNNTGLSFCNSNGLDSFTTLSYKWLVITPTTAQKFFLSGSLSLVLAQKHIGVNAEE